MVLLSSPVQRRVAGNYKMYQIMAWPFKIHHGSNDSSSSCLDIPFLSSFSAKAKISYLSAVTVSKDPLINEIASLSSAPSFRAAACIPESAVDALQLAISSVSEISRKTLPRAVRCLFDDMSRNRWDKKFTGLSVQ